MNKYLLLLVGGEMPQGDAGHEQFRQAWDAWTRDLGDALRDAGSLFTPRALSIMTDRSIEEGPVVCMATGYFIIEAESLEAAAQLARSCPAVEAGACISVFESLPAAHTARL